MRRALVSLVSLAGLVAPAHANPLDAFGFGARAMALGSAATAVSDDSAANYYNPAGLARSPDLRLDLGYTLVRPALSLNDHDLQVDDSRGFQGGVVLPGRAWDRRLALSIGLHLPDERVSRIRALPERQPRWVLYDNRPQRIVISSSGAFEVLDGLLIGAGMTYLANTGGTLAIDGQVSLTDAERTRLLSAVDVDLSSVRYLTVGALFERGDWRVGLTWREDFSLKLDLDVDVRGRIVAGPGDATLVEEGRFFFKSTSDTLYSPEQIFLGVAWTRGPWLVTADLGWVRWSQFPTPTAAVALELDLGNLPFDVPLPGEPADPDFEDLFVPRVGAEWAAYDGPLVGIALRLGYFYEPSPAPDQPGRTNYVDSDKHALSAGLGLRLAQWTAVFPKPLHLDLAMQTVRLVSRTYLKDDAADPVGDYEASGHTWGGAMNLGFRF